MSGSRPGWAAAARAGGALLLALAAVGCKDAATPASGGGTTSAASSTAAAVTIDDLAAKAKGFSAGPTMSARVGYVFFDAQCPHCGTLWDAAKPLRTQARLVWIPVGLLNPNSINQGAAILAAPDPVAAMDQHEALLLGGKGGMSAPEAPPPRKAEIVANTSLMDSYRFQSVPVVIARDPNTGSAVVAEGAVSTQRLAQMLGIPDAPR